MHYRLRGLRAAILAAGMILATAAPALAANPKYITDWSTVPAWASTALEDVVRWEIMSGYPVQDKPAYWGEFRPFGMVTRAEFAVILSRALDENGAGALASGFADVPPDAWYTQNLNGLAQAGIVKVADYPSGALQPHEPITRAELATWVGRAAARESVTAAQPDPGLQDLAGEKYRDEILLAARAGIVRGYEDRTFRPAATATRAEAAAMIHRLINQMTANPPDIAHLQRLYAEGMAVLTWAEKQHDPKLATREGLAPHLERYDSPAMFAGDVEEQGFFLGNPVWYSEKRHIVEQPVFLGKTVAITIGGSMHRTKLDNGAWEVSRGWSARGGYNWWRRINGRWVLAGGKVYQTTPNPTTWELPPFYDPAAYNPSRSKPEDIAGSWWGEDGVLIYDPGSNPPETAMFGGPTNDDGLVMKWEKPVQ